MKTNKYDYYENHMLQESELEDMDQVDFKAMYYKHIGKSTGFKSTYRQSKENKKW